MQRLLQRQKRGRTFEKIQEYEPDIVISDVAMPRMTGLDVIKAIRANESNTKVIF